jgi:hypothetical protein
MNSTACAIQCPLFGTAQTTLGHREVRRDSVALPATPACPTDREPFFQLLGGQMRTIFLPPPPLSNASVIAIRRHFLASPNERVVRNSVDREGGFHLTAHRRKITPT